jgi:hypothetical protein
MIFAREISDGLTGLVKKLDGEVAKNKKSARMGAFVVFLTDEDNFESKVKDLQSKAGVKNVSLTIDNPAGPSTYKVAKDADVTVVFYKGHQVKANHAFKKGEFTEKSIDAVVADLSKILN